MNSAASESLRFDGKGSDEVQGAFVDFNGERNYLIHNVDKMAPFFVSVISSDDHWLFVSSTGALTAGRVSPETALFPYVTVDKIHDNNLNTGGRTVIRCAGADGSNCWEPYNREQDARFSTTRNLYKNLLGSKLCFEEINHDLELCFRTTWLTSAEYGFVRRCELVNLGSESRSVEFVDGLQNLLPAGTPRFTQTNSSNLVDAYKWSELDEETGLAFLTLYSGISDRAEPCESLRATTVYALGLNNPTVMLSTSQIDRFRNQQPLVQERQTRGIRGAYLVHANEDIAAGETLTWSIVADMEQSQSEVVALRKRLSDPGSLLDEINASVEEGTDALARIMAGGDAFQETAEENVSGHHYANVLFNVLRGGIYDEQYTISGNDFRKTVSIFNKATAARNEALLAALPDKVSLGGFLEATGKGDAQLRRLAREYLPIYFGRRHGDPSRPWNQFAINLVDDEGEPFLSYEGNWRDIFQNWEALAFSYPAFIENMIAKFVNASTADGYNPYRITKEGIDWEVEEPDNPWSYIGYWGDHQIIYLLKLLELSRNFHPETLQQLLRDPLFCYANVPYRIKPLDALLADPKNTVLFDEELAETIEERVAEFGADGKLVLDADGNVYQVNLLEKLLVPLLCKLGNLVVDGGIWLNTQRPEWNDANNALVGQGLSMVTLYYMRRYVRFMLDLLETDSGSFAVSSEVADWLAHTATALADLRAASNNGPVDDELRFTSLTKLGRAASDHRETFYARGFSGSVNELAIDDVRRLLEDALQVIDHSIANNEGDDGLYQAYNIADFGEQELPVEHLYPMLEGQVAALSAGSIDAERVADVLEALFSSAVYREDQDSFMLYPDRDLPGFLVRNQVSEKDAVAIPLLKTMLDAGDDRLILRDAEGGIRFNADFTNAGDVKAMLDELVGEYGESATEARAGILEIYESVFNHKAFTGRSGTMFGFEGLGSIYWHMVAKLLLAVEENFFAALDNDADEATLKRLGDYYYRVRAGIGFNKTPAEYGAFPTDPYSHTPKHAGARQPGMTGQVKEEVLTRFGELGIRVSEGAATIDPALLRAREFAAESRSFCYLDVFDAWQHIDVQASSLAFTWCQVPVIYVLDESAAAGIELELDDGARSRFEEFTLPANICSSIFERTGRIRKITATFGRDRLFGN